MSATRLLEPLDRSDFTLSDLYVFIKCINHGTVDCVTLRHETFRCFALVSGYLHVVLYYIFVMLFRFNDKTDLTYQQLHHLIIW